MPSTPCSLQVDPITKSGDRKMSFSPSKESTKSLQYLSLCLSIDTFSFVSVMRGASVSHRLVFGEGNFCWIYTSEKILVGYIHQKIFLLDIYPSKNISWWIHTSKNIIIDKKNEIEESVVLLGYHDEGYWQQIAQIVPANEGQQLQLAMAKHSYLLDGTRFNQ